MLFHIALDLRDQGRDRAPHLSLAPNTYSRLFYYRISATHKLSWREGESHPYNPEVDALPNELLPLQLNQTNSFPGGFSISPYFQVFQHMLAHSVLEINQAKLKL